MDTKSTLECSVVMLPTEKRVIGSICYVHANSNQETSDRLLIVLNSVNQLDKEFLKPQHVYFVSDEWIKSDEYAIIKNDAVSPNPRVVKIISVEGIYYVTTLGNYPHNHCLKIIATTDASINLPAIPVEWLRTKYVPANGKIDNVRLRMTPDWQIDEDADEHGKWQLELTDKNEVVIVDEPKIVKIEGGLPKNNHDGTMSITPLVAVYEDGSRSDDKNPEKLLEDAAEKYANNNPLKSPRINFIQGWKANPNKWTDDDVVKIMEELVYDERKEVGSITGGLSTCHGIAKCFLAHYKKTHSKQ